MCDTCSDLSARVEALERQQEALAAALLDALALTFVTMTLAELTMPTDHRRAAFDAYAAHGGCVLGKAANALEATTPGMTAEAINTILGAELARGRQFAMLLSPRFILPSGAQN